MTNRVSLLRPDHPPAITARISKSLVQASKRPSVQNLVHNLPILRNLVLDDRVLEKRVSCCISPKLLHPSIIQPFSSLKPQATLHPSPVIYLSFAKLTSPLPDLHRTPLSLDFEANHQAAYHYPRPLFRSLSHACILHQFE